MYTYLFLRPLALIKLHRQLETFRNSCITAGTGKNPKRDKKGATRRVYINGWVGPELGELVVRTFRGRLVGASLKFKVMSTVVGPRCISPTAKDRNNDAFAPHSALLALTATITMDCQRRLWSLSVWVDSGL